MDPLGWTGPRYMATFAQGYSTWRASHTVHASDYLLRFAGDILYSSEDGMSFGMDPEVLSECQEGELKQDELKQAHKSLVKFS